MRKPRVSIGLIRAAAESCHRHGVTKAQAATAVGALVRDLAGENAPDLTETVLGVLDEVWSMPREIL